MARSTRCSSTSAGCSTSPTTTASSAALGRRRRPRRPDDLDRAHYAGVAALTDFTDGDRASGWRTSRRTPRPRPCADGAARRGRRAADAEFGRAACGPGSIPGSRRRGSGRWWRWAVKLAIVSNADGTRRGSSCATTGSARSARARRRCRRVLDSAVVGVAKPDPAIFELALERLGVAAERALHVGDTLGRRRRGRPRRRRPARPP